MQQTITKSSFMDSFKEMGRENNFSYNGLSVLYDYLIELEDDTDNELNLDVIALCCDYSEYKDLEEYLNDYSNTHEAKTEEETEEEFKERIETEISEHTTLIKLNEDIDEGFIIQCF